MGETGPLVDPADVPDWMRKLVEATAELDPRGFPRFVPRPRPNARPAAVLMLFGESAADGRPDVLLLRRADTLDSHAGQVAFPGGGAEIGDSGPVATALREAAEEVGLQPDGVRPVALLPRLHVPVSNFDVTPVLAYWERPEPVRPVDARETAAVARVPIDYLADPTHRLLTRGPLGYVGPAFLVPGMLIWGFTAVLLTLLLSLGGWEREWDSADARDLDDAWQAAMELDGALVDGAPFQNVRGVRVDGVINPEVPR